MKKLQAAFVGSTSLIVVCSSALTQSDHNRPDYAVISIQRDSTRAAEGRRFGCSGVDLIAGAADPIPIGTCRGIHATFRMIVAEALSISPNEPFLTGGPSRFDLDTFVNQVSGDPQVTYAQLRAKLKTLLVRHFGLEFHLIQRSIVGYELTVDSLSDKVLKVIPDPVHPGTVSNEQESVIFRRFTMAMLAEFLSAGLHMPVVDKTELTDPYTFTIKVPPAKSPTPAGAVRDVSGPKIFSVLREQLGLRMTPASVRIDAVVVDRLRPTTLK